MNKFICKKVVSMLSLYIENKLDDEDKFFVENHFTICPDCYQKYIEMKDIISNLHFEYEKLIEEFDKIESTKMFNIREYESFYNNISPYIDDELCYNESIKFRKYLLKSKPARTELANAYNLKNNIRHSVAIFKDNVNVNFSRKVIKRLQNETPEPFEKIYKKAAVFIIVMVSTLLAVSLFVGFNFKENNLVLPSTANSSSPSEYSQNKEQSIENIQFPENQDDLVEFSFDENNEALLTAR